MLSLPAASSTASAEAVLPPVMLRFAAGAPAAPRPSVPATDRVAPLPASKLPDARVAVADCRMVLADNSSRPPAPPWPSARPVNAKLPTSAVLPSNRASAASPGLAAELVMVCTAAPAGPVTVTSSRAPGALADGLVPSVVSAQLEARPHAPPPIESHT